MKSEDSRRIKLKSKSGIVSPLNKENAVPTENSQQSRRLNNLVTRGHLS